MNVWRVSCGRWSDIPTFLQNRFIGFMRSFKVYPGGISVSDLEAAARA